MGEVEEVVGEQGPPGSRIVPDPNRGLSSGLNRGLRSAGHPTVLVTDDDCTVERDWVGTAEVLARRHPAEIITGSVLPVGDPARVPSCKTDPEPRDFTGTREPSALYGGNMLLPRDAVLAIGGFDERLLEAAMDSDLGYRWLRAGRGLRYEPALVVHHHDWRTTEQLERLYGRYARGSGAFYGKHLRQGDLGVTPYLMRHLRAGIRADPHRSVLPGVLRGFFYGLRRLGGEVRSAR